MISSSRSVHLRSLCVSSSDTLVASGSPKEDERQSKVSSKKEGDDSEDLKFWMDKNGLPPCKVILKERPAHDQKHKPIHYVAASEDLQVVDLAFQQFYLLIHSSIGYSKYQFPGFDGKFFLITCLLQKGDVAFSVPDSLVVTLERVLGNETIGMRHSLLCFLFHKATSSVMHYNIWIRLCDFS